MDSYDMWKTATPDEFEPESKCKCKYCGESLFEDDEYYELDGEILCEDCAEEWLKGHRNWVTEGMEKGEGFGSC